jgi:translocation protein SEC63
MLVKSPELLDGLIEIAQHRKWFDASISAIQLSQCIIQALWPSADPFLQLPFVTEEDIKRIKSNKSIKSFSQFLKLSDAEKKKGIENLSSEQQKEFLTVSALFPRLKIETKLFVEEDEPEEEGPGNEPTNNPTAVVRGDQIFEQDLVTLKVTLTRENLSDGASNSPVFAPHFPATVYENWWVVLTDKSHKGHNHAPGKEHGPVIHAFEKISDQSRVVTHEVKFYAPQKEGKYEVELQIFSDSYLGLDETFVIPFEVFPAASLPEYTPHPEDLELDNEPTVFEQLMANNQDDSSDEEDEDEEEDTVAASAPNKKGPASSQASAATKNPTKPAGGKKKPTRVIEEVEDEDD